MLNLKARLVNLPSNFQSWNPAMRGAYLKGAKAAEAGETLAKCPYDDKRKADGRLSWSRAFIAAWRDGWNDWRAQNPIAANYNDKRSGGLAALAR